MLQVLVDGGAEFGPFRFAVEPGPLGWNVLRASWPAQKFERLFVIACRTEWSRRAVERACEQVKANTPPYPALLVFPYLSEEALDDLEAAGISGIDLSGNGIILDPPHLFVRCTGKKSRLKVTSGDYSVYLSSNVASLVPRVFLLQSRFFTAKAVMEACHTRMSPLEGRTQPLVLPTVSKALTQLKRDLVIDQEGRRLSLRDPVRILTELYRSFRPPTTLEFMGKTALSNEAVWSRLRELRGRVRVVVTGRGSAGHYTGLAGPERLQLYVSDLNLVKDVLQARPTVAFPNLELHETDEEAAYFDAREHAGTLWASPIQTFLELTQGTARELDVASELRAHILNEAASRPT